MRSCVPGQERRPCQFLQRMGIKSSCPRTPGWHLPTPTHPWAIDPEVARKAAGLLQCEEAELRLVNLENCNANFVSATALAH